MNTRVQTHLYSQTPAADILPDVERLFASIEKCLSRFDPDSELSRLNKNEKEVFRASPNLIDAVEVALWGAETSAGLYDPTVLPDLEEAGYDRSFDLMENVAPLSESVRLRQNDELIQPVYRQFTFQSIHLNRTRREIYKPPELRLDLGGMGKGWAVDRAADRLQGLGPFLVNAGGDIFAYHTPPGQKGWKIDIIHPLKPGHFMARLYLYHRALATSTIAKRRWQRNGQIMHHLIDPRTGQPAQTDAISVSVVADRTVMAEIFAKVALILGAKQGLTYLQDLPGVEGLIFTTEAEILYTNGLRAMLDRVEPVGYPA
jgi:thiamine biosynthesis lipoprotein